MKLGPITLSVEELKIGLGSILIVFLPNALIIFLFKFARNVNREGDKYVREQYEMPGEENEEMKNKSAKIKKCMIQLHFAIFNGHI